jgi:hypothetical protein
MGGYSTSRYLGFALGSFARGPVITRYGYPLGFAAGAVAAAIGAFAVAVLWVAGRVRAPQRSKVIHSATCPKSKASEVRRTAYPSGSSRLSSTARFIVVRSS